MVAGIETFKEFFKDFSENYVIIGGTACDIIIENAGFTPRATDDIDIILMVEALTPEFTIRFWEFIKQGKYKKKQKDLDKRNCYRFIEPETEDFPVQIELFSRIPDAIDLAEFSHLAPIPVDEGLSSLSAILLNDDYYQFTRKNSELKDGVHYAKTETLICLKAYAYLNNKVRKEAGEKVRTENILKHKYDIFRLVFLLNQTDAFELPESIKKDLTQFANSIKDDLPDSNIFKRNGFGKQNMEIVFRQFLKSFYIEIL